jgi:formamidopyrimidine-DNA glycosylase
MPEIPDLTVYLEHLAQRTKGERFEGLRLSSPFLLRTVAPKPDALVGRAVVGWHRLGKQLVCELEGEHFIVIHLMISGRLWWEKKAARIPKGRGLAAFDFSSGTLVLTEASKKRRASLRLVGSRDDLSALDPGGLEVLAIDEATFAARLRSANHTLKRALTDQHVFAGIGNAYSDEILLHAKLSPFKQAAQLTDDEIARLFAAAREWLGKWVDILREKTGDRWPSHVTAFHPEMAVHGRYREPCPVCGAPVQRIVYAENEANYCARCQTGGRLLADRSLSRLLKQNWPKRLEDLE